MNDFQHKWYVGYHYYTYILTYSMEQSPSWKANRFSVSPEIRRSLWNRIHKYPPLVPVGSCYHGMARLQVVDGGTASNMEGSCEYIE
jgi:hypothetical protein